jgi:hypothetical protein
VCDAVRSVAYTTRSSESERADPRVPTPTGRPVPVPLDLAAGGGALVR